MSIMNSGFSGDDVDPADIVNPLLLDDDDDFDSEALPDFNEDDLKSFLVPAEGSEKRELIPGTMEDASYSVNYDDYVQQDIARGLRDPDDGVSSVAETFNSVLNNTYGEDDTDYSDEYERDDFSNIDDRDEVLSDTDSSEDSDEDSGSSLSASLEELLNIQEAALEDSDSSFDDEDDFPASGSMFSIVDDEDEFSAHQLNIDSILGRAIDMNASDIDLIPNDEVVFTILGNIERVSEFGVLTGRQIYNSFVDITTSVSQDDFLRFPELDTSYTIRRGKHAGRRLRLNVTKTFGEHSMVFRVISDRIPSPSELNMDNRLLGWSKLPNGLVLVNGPTGAGKALRLDTVVPTPHGSKTMGDLRVGDVVYDSQMNKCNVEWVSDTNYHPELYKIVFSDGQEIFADKDHQWIVSSKFSRDSFDVEGSESLLRTVNTLDLLEGDCGFAVPCANVSEGVYENWLMSEDSRWNFVVSVDRILESDFGYGPVLCIGVDSPDHSYLCADNVVTHNSTTLASIIREIQMSRAEKIVTVEKPVEYIYGIAGLAAVVQREVGPDTKNFSAALDSAMRQHPDVLLIGEVRNKEEVNAVLYAAETGHLAFSTMHTNSTASTLSRIKRMFTGDEQNRILGDLSEVARGFSNQVLVRSPDGKSRSSVNEVLEVSDDVRKMILDGDVRSIVRYQEDTGSTMEHELVKAIKAGRCNIQEAYRNSSFPARLGKLLEDEDIV